MERLLRSLVADPRVTDILINGDGTIWVDRGAELERLTDRIPDAAAVRRLAVRLAADARRRLDDAMPYADGQLSSGIRLHAVLAPVATDGAHIFAGATSHRIHPRGSDRPGSVSDEQGAGCGTSRLAADGSRLRRHRDRQDHRARRVARRCPRRGLVVVEDVTELHVEHPHVVRLGAAPQRRGSR